MLSSVDWILMDIEGTTSSLTFVHETLFPYARANMRQWLSDNRGEPWMSGILDSLHEEATADWAAGSDDALIPPKSISDDAELDAVVARLTQLMDEDRKSTPLKDIQGKIWHEGFTSGVLRGHLYPDVLPAWERWEKASKRLAIYSSGSIAAQKLLFKYNEFGDLSPWLEAQFDTTSGGKLFAESYRNIAAALEAAPSKILFLTDNLGEADAAREAGLLTAVAIRPANPALPAHEHPEFIDFSELK